MFNLTTQHKLGVLQWLIVEQPVQFCPLCRGVAVLVLNGNAVDGNSRAVRKLGFHPVGVHIVVARVIYVFGADLCDKTPIFDIKPYVPLSDCVPDALEGYTKMTKEHILSVHIPEEKALLLPKNKLAALKEILQLDPRPGYDDSPEKLYGLSFAGYNIKFSVKNDVLCVSDIEKNKR